MKQRIAEREIKTTRIGFIGLNSIGQFSEKKKYKLTRNFLLYLFHTQKKKCHGSTLHFFIQQLNTVNVQAKRRQ